jgi:hypothetical protein
MEEQLQKRVKGQEAAISSICKVTEGAYDGKKGRKEKRTDSAHCMSGVA